MKTILNLWPLKMMKIIPKNSDNTDETVKENPSEVQNDQRKVGSNEPRNKHNDQIMVEEIDEYKEELEEKTFKGQLISEGNFDVFKSPKK